MRKQKNPLAWVYFKLVFSRQNMQQHGVMSPTAPFFSVRTSLPGDFSLISANKNSRSSLASPTVRVYFLWVSPNVLAKEEEKQRGESRPPSEIILFTGSSERRYPFICLNSTACREKKNRAMNSTDVTRGSSIFHRPLNAKPLL